MCLDMERINSLPDNAMLKVKPKLYNEWDFHKNDELGFDIWKITKGSKKKIWWNCNKCKSRFNTSPDKRVSRNSSCPYCTGQKVNHTNSLATLNPKLAKEWDSEKNGELTPHNVTCGSNKKAWWRCVKCDSSYRSSVSKRSTGSGCPYCRGLRVNHTNSLATLNPKLASEWHPTKNGDLTPYDITCGVHYKAWWLGKCGHEWEASVCSRRDTVGCPYCANYKVLKGFNDIFTTHHYLVELLVDKEDAYKHIAGGYSVLKWKCKNCGTIDSKKCSDVSSGRWTCKACSDGVSYPHKFMVNVLNFLNIEFKQEVKFEWSNNKIYDFYIPHLNMIIEAHGEQHYKETTRGRTLKEEQENDVYKRDLAMLNNISNYVELDCRESNLEWIKNSIYSSILSSFIDLQSIDWKMIGEKSERSLVVECWKLYNEGKNSKDIYEHLNISRITYNKYIKNGKQLGLLIDRNPTVTILELDSNMNIIQEFDNKSRYYKDINKKGQILRVLRGESNHCKGLRYMYKEDYEKLCAIN